MRPWTFTSENIPYLCAYFWCHINLLQVSLHWLVFSIYHLTFLTLMIFHINLLQVSLPSSVLSIYYHHTFLTLMIFYIILLQVSSHLPVAYFRYVTIHFWHWWSFISSSCKFPYLHLYFKYVTLLFDTDDPSHQSLKECLTFTWALDRSITLPFWHWRSLISTSWRFLLPSPVLSTSYLTSPTPVPRDLVQFPDHRRLLHATQSRRPARARDRGPLSPVTASRSAGSTRFLGASAGYS